PSYKYLVSSSVSFSFTCLLNASSTLIFLSSKIHIPGSNVIGNFTLPLIGTINIFTPSLSNLLLTITNFFNNCMYCVILLFTIFQGMIEGRSYESGGETICLG